MIIICDEFSVYFIFNTIDIFIFQQIIIIKVLKQSLIFSFLKKFWLLPDCVRIPNQ